MRKTIGFLSIALFLTACGTALSSLPFPTTLPSGETLDQNYKGIIHDLSPLETYHFRMQVPKDWITLDTSIKEEPALNALTDVAIFRQPGSWSTDPLAPIDGEISVSVVNVSGSTLSPRDWLDGILKKNSGAYTIVNKRSSPSAAGEVPDLLIKYDAGDETIVSRMMAFKSGSRMFVITGSDTAAEYPQNAEAFNVAISSFRLVSAGR